MASLNPSSNISAFINTVFEAAILVAYENTVMAKTVRNFNDRTGVAVRQNSQYGGATINDIGETDDLVGQTFTPASIATLTPSEAGGQYFLTDTRVESDPFAVRNDAAQDLGLAMATKIETDLIAGFTSFTAGTVGAAGSTITWAKVYNMEAILRNAKAPYPYSLVLHPYQWNELAKVASVASSASTNAAPSLLEAVNSMYFVKQIGGVYIFVSANIPVISGDDAYCGMFSKDALALDMRRQPRIEPERDASRRGWELNMSAVYGHGIWRPTFGVAGIFDALTPS
jgi:hypothetical protein